MTVTENDLVVLSLKFTTVWLLPKAFETSEVAFDWTGEWEMFTWFDYTFIFTIISHNHVLIWRGILEEMFLHEHVNIIVPVSLMFNFRIFLKCK